MFSPDFNIGCVFSSLSFQECAYQLINYLIPSLLPERHFPLFTSRRCGICTVHLPIVSDRITLFFLFMGNSSLFIVSCLQRSRMAFCGFGLFYVTVVDSASHVLPWGLSGG